MKGPCVCVSDHVLFKFVFGATILIANGTDMNTCSEVVGVFVRMHCPFGDKLNVTFVTRNGKNSFVSHHVVCYAVSTRKSNIFLSQPSLQLDKFLIFLLYSI